jgi:L-aspartate oxidase
VAAGEASDPGDASRLELESPATGARDADRDFSAGDLSNSMKSLLWKRVGIVRTGLALLEAGRRIESWQQVADRLGRPSPRDWELRNMLVVARALTRAARERDESRGTHFRSDFPRRDDARWRADLVLQRTASGDLDIARTPVDAPLAPPSGGTEFGE